MRKYKKSWSVGIILAAAIIVVGIVSHISAADDYTQAITIDVGTSIAPTVSSDNNTVVMELHGVLWSLPASGGTATRLTEDFLEPARPDFSPIGHLIAFQAFKGGTFHIWVMNPDGSGLRQLTNGQGDDREPRFSPDGTRIAFASDRAFNGSYDIWVAELASGALTQMTSNPDLEEFEPTWSPDGSEIAFLSGTSSRVRRIEAVNFSGGRRTVLEAPSGYSLNSPSWSPDGSRIAYVQFGSNKSQLMVSGVNVAPFDDVTPYYPNWISGSEILYAADGGLRMTDVDTGSTRSIPFEATFHLERKPYAKKQFDFDSRKRRPVKGILTPALSPDGKRIVFVALNQVWVMKIGRKPRRLTNDTYFKVDPSWSPDGTKLAYSSDKAGTQDLYIFDFTTGREERVTSIAGAEVSSAWSPDGTMLAFNDQNGQTWTVDLVTHEIREVMGRLFQPGRPTWSADSNTIAFAAVRQYTRRFREGVSAILTVDLTTGDATYADVIPFKSFSTRGEDGPVWSPDGTAMACVIESALWILPVDEQGGATGPAVRINDEVTDAPTWSGDSQTLLYLSGGQLRLISRDGSNLRTVPVRLSWKQDKPSGRTIIHAGKFWDGRGPEVLIDVDITVVKNRIKSIKPHRKERHRGYRNGRHGGNHRFIDASEQTVVPGIWESHFHQYYRGKFFGDRQGRLWLSYGVTSHMGMSDPAYRFVESREAIWSGARVAPRMFGSGEAIDGDRIYYNFMRPVSGGPENMARELARIQALEYDNVKTYVRLPHAKLPGILEFLHDDLGIWAASHYCMPNIAYGQDGIAHRSATTRLGISTTRSPAGVTYQDVIDLFANSGAFMMNTPFNSTLLAEDPTMVDDLRLTTLNTPWDQVRLLARRDYSVENDQSLRLDALSKEMSTVVRMLDGGGTLLAGTDAALDFIATALHLNLRGQVMFGLEPWEALQTATLLPARTFGVEEDLGTLEPGKLADLIIVDGNPVERIEDLANVQAVMKNGRLYTVAELMYPFTPDGLAAGEAITPMPSRRLSHPFTDNKALKAKYWWHDPKKQEEEEGDDE